MNFAKVFCYRTYQKTLYIAQSMMHFRIPVVKESIFDCVLLLKEKGLDHPILVVSNTVRKSDSFQSLLEKFDKNGISYSIFSKVTPDPTFSLIIELKEFYLSNQCDSIIAIGGGSVMDASKAMGVLVTHRKKELKDFKGVLKVKHKLPYFIAVPTTAGTGSEATVASVVTNEKTNDKFAINDPKLIPNVAILDDSLLKTLPPKIIAETGMDALCHALEAYIGKSSTKLTNRYALDAIKLIYENLYEFYLNPNNDIARKNMLYASFYAGIAFTRAYVGYVHALAHSVGGYYHKSHGYSIAILLPYVLDGYGKKAYKKLSMIAKHLKISENQKEESSKKIIEWIKNLNQSMGIPDNFMGIIEEKNYDELVCHSYKEANPLYPVPKELTKKELREILVLANKGIK